IMLLGFSHFLLKGKPALPYIVRTYGLSLMAVVLSLLPYGIGKMIGRNVHSSSADYLTSTIQQAINYTSLRLIDYVAFAFIPILLLFLIKRGSGAQQRLTALFTALLGISTFLLYYAGGKMTRSVLISSRSQDLWALVIPVLIGAGVFALVQVLPAFFRKKYWETAVSILLISFVLVALHPEPITAYKMERDSFIEQYLRIRDSYSPKMWSIVSQDEEYSVVLGSGVHMYVKDFLNYYDANKPPLTRKGSNKRDYNVPQDIFVFYEKHIFEVSKSNSIYSLLKPKYDQRQKDSDNFKKWLNQYRQSGHKVELYYDDPDFAVYHFHIPAIKQKLKKRFWED
ncbi:MAG: hypothetical protein Q8906_09185, partial [Bacillota bacterium]|nr:hypothetical protein [Bacillota bacterium]